MLHDNIIFILLRLLQKLNCDLVAQECNFQETGLGKVQKAEVPSDDFARLISFLLSLNASSSKQSSFDCPFVFAYICSLMRCHHTTSGRDTFCYNCVFEITFRSQAVSLPDNTLVKSTMCFLFLMPVNEMYFILFFLCFVQIWFFFQRLKKVRNNHFVMWNSHK